MTPEKIAFSGTEHAHQSAFMAWLRMAQNYGIAAANDAGCYQKGGEEHATKWYGKAAGISELKYMAARPNGGERNRVVATMLVAEGVKRGAPDLDLPWPRGQYIGLAIEMKKPGGRTSAEQVDWLDFLSRQGWCVAVCHTWLEAVQVLTAYVACGEPL